MKDLLIVGGGPAGLSAGIMAANSGMSVGIIEPKSGVIDKACGEGLMPAAVTKLSDMGVRLQRSHPFKGIRYVDGEKFADGHFSNEPGLGVRRLELHRSLLERANELGVEQIEMRAKNFSQTDDRVIVDGQECRHLLVADGLHSPIRKKLGLNMPGKRPARLGIRRHFNMKPWSPYVEVHWSPFAEAYVTPVDDNLVGVAILFYKEKHARPETQDRYFELLSLFPELKKRLSEPPCTKLRGAGPFEQLVKQRVQGRIMLIGDAAGYLDPLTGEGIRLGLDSAEAAINCIKRDRPHEYERDWRRVTRRYWWMTDGLLKLRRVPTLRRWMVPTLKRFPWIFDRILKALAED